MDQWTKALEKLGVEEIPGEGSTFDQLTQVSNTRANI